MSSPGHGGYLVLQHLGGHDWRVLGEVDRRPSSGAEARSQAVRDLLVREVKHGQLFAVLPRSEWRNALEH